MKWKSKVGTPMIPKLNFHFGSWKSQGVANILFKIKGTKLRPNWAFFNPFKRF
jgi:hypothetical protein